MDKEGQDHDESQNGLLKHLLYFSVAVGNKQSFFQGLNLSFSVLTVGMGFL